MCLCFLFRKWEQDHLMEQAYVMLSNSSNIHTWEMFNNVAKSFPDLEEDSVLKVVRRDF